MTVTILRNVEKLFWLFFPIERFVFFFCHIYVWMLASAFTSVSTILNILLVSHHIEMWRFYGWITKFQNYNGACSFWGTLFSATRAAIHLRISLVHAYPFGDCTWGGLE